jgi:hypothetical protein
MSSIPTPDEIVRDAGWLVQALDPAAGVARTIAMDREAYRAASFLDDRMLQSGVEARLVPWSAVAEAVPIISRRDARWIFHIGHVGSTLIARLLGEVPGVLSVREPRFLRDLTVISADERKPFTQAAQALFSRTFAQDELALVKATSFVSEIAPELVPTGERAMFMFASPRNYIASILAGENSVKELALLAPSRASRMAPRVRPAEPRNDAESAALAWACEMTALEAAAEAMPDRFIAWLDFDHFLASPEPRLGEIADHFGFPSTNLGAIADGPLMRRYSKAPEFEYSPALRRDLIAQAAHANAGEIDDALAMLRAAAETSPLLARALARSGEG